MGDLVLVLICPNGGVTQGDLPPLPSLATCGRWESWASPSSATVLGDVVSTPQLSTSRADPDDVGMGEPHPEGMKAGCPLLFAAGVN